MVLKTWHLGFVLRPLLFLLYTNDVISVNPYVHLILYAYKYIPQLLKNQELKIDSRGSPRNTKMHEGRKVSKIENF